MHYEENFQVTFLKKYKIRQITICIKEASEGSDDFYNY